MSAEVLSREGFDPAASVGLFVGVSTFEHGRFAEVPFAVDDAVDLACLFALELDLIRPQGVVLALAGEPRKAESQAGLERLLGLGARRMSARLIPVYRQLGELARASGPEGLLLLTVATHGVSDQRGDILLAQDSLAERLIKTGLEVDDLFDEVAGARSPRRLVLLDACREHLTAGTRQLGGAAMARSFAAAIGKAKGQVVLSGSTLGGYAYDDLERCNGVFTAAVVDGLRGAAPADARGFITARTLGDFLQERVVDWVRRHRPKDAERSTGIARRIEGAAETLPLAVDPQRSRELEQYRARRSAALSRLKDNIDVVLEGSHYDQAVALLPAEAPEAGSGRLLDEIEALDGSERAQRSLRDFLRELGAEAAPLAVPVSARPSAALAAVSTRPMQPAAPPPDPAFPIQPASALLADRPTSQLRRPVRRGLLRAAMRAAWGAPLLGIILLLLGFGLFSGILEPERKAGLQPAGEPVAAVTTEPVAGTPWDGPLGMRFRFVPAGTYWIGSPEDEPGRFEHEKRHQTRLTRGVWIAETEVTQVQWGSLVSENPSRFAACGGNCPVENVNWYEAAAFANRVSESSRLPTCYDLSGCSGTPGADYECTAATFRGLDCLGFRLPTDSEWEIAARAGRETALYTGDLTLRGANHGPELDVIAWYGGNSRVTYAGGHDCSRWPEKQYPAETCGTHPVRAKRASPWGFHDLLGNVQEWTGDWYGVSGVSTGGAAVDSMGTRVIRGGSWLSLARYVRAAVRGHYGPSARGSNLGFRLARGQGPEPEERRSRG